MVYKKILIINPFGIGDVLFTTPIIHTLKEAFPGVELSYLCNRRSAPLLETNPYIRHLFIYDRDELLHALRHSVFAWFSKIFSLVRRIKAEHFDVALDLSLNKEYGFFSWYAGIRERVGYNFKNRGIFLTKKVFLLGYQNKHVIEYYGSLLKYLGLDLKYRVPELYLTDLDKKWAEDFLRGENILPGHILVAIIPGAGKSWGKDSYLKHWPSEAFAVLADKLIEKKQAAVIILGDPSDQDIAGEVLLNMRNKVINLAGITTIGQLAALIDKAKLVIANDGGPLHMAVALGKKTVSFFGPVDPKVYGPYPADEKRHVVLSLNLECSPCYRNFRLSECSKDRRCLKGISVERAWEEVSKLL